MGELTQESKPFLEAYHAEGQKDILGELRLAVLYGAKAHNQANSELLAQLLKLALPQELLQVIALNDQKRVRDILATTPNAITDDNGISALGYAAGQGNTAILNILLNHPAYSHNTTAIEQALEIVANRVKAFSEPAIGYTEREDRDRQRMLAQYEEIYNGLKAHLSLALQQQLDEFEKKAAEQLGLSEMHEQFGLLPIEIQQMIFKNMLGNKEIFNLLYGPGK
ncbi:MAG TPA: hypothetical protein VHA52_07960 [Candidatus Babeliaceae bacterium]|nr:hypothetical protein [Candidatus Babeliaceae bacterium]